MRQQAHTPKDVIRVMVADCGKSMREISAELGRSPSWLSAVLAHDGDIQISTFEEIADACGWKIIATRDSELGSSFDVPFVRITYRESDPRE